MSWTKEIAFPAFVLQRTFPQSTKVFARKTRPVMNWRQAFRQFGSRSHTRDSFIQLCPRTVWPNHVRWLHFWRSSIARQLRAMHTIQPLTISCACSTTLVVSTTAFFYFAHKLTLEPMHSLWKNYVSNSQHVCCTKIHYFLAQINAIRRRERFLLLLHWFYDFSSRMFYVQFARFIECFCFAFTSFDE